MPIRPNWFEYCSGCSDTGASIYHVSPDYYSEAETAGVSIAAGFTIAAINTLIANERNAMPTNSTPTAAQVREWARGQGYYVARTGRVPNWITMAYRRANTPVSSTPGMHNVDTLYVHEDGSNCVARHFGRPCAENHAETVPDRPHIVWSSNYGELRPGEIRIVEDAWGYGDGRFFVEGSWGRYSDWSEVRNSRIAIVPRAVPCTYCGSSSQGVRHEIEGQQYCSNCVTVCSCHGRYFAPGSESVQNSAGEYRCIGFEYHCANCGEDIIGSGSYSYTLRRTVCDSCIPRCAVCNSELNERSRCDSCRRRNRSRNVRAYQTTVPTMWLGGNGEPSTKDGSYFLGFELEVSADYDDDTEPLKEWARANLGHRDALDLKEDSSVQGFEIVSMPMTPDFFESVDWDSFFAMLNDSLTEPAIEDEPEAHGLHVHISRTAFRGSRTAVAAFSYLLSGNSEHLERISRRRATHYCSKINYPVSEAVVSHGTDTKQAVRIAGKRIRPQRGAINHTDHYGRLAQTVEVRAGKSTRSPEALRAQVRLVYLAAEYVRSLMTDGSGFVAPKALAWECFINWVSKAAPEALSSLTGNNEN